jgi:riboflavin synthase
LKVVEEWTRDEPGSIDSWNDVTCNERIAVDGAALAIIERGEQWLHVESMPETLRCTRLGSLQPGAHVNLERALPSDG